LNQGPLPYQGSAL